ncbi:MAG: efflux RND transporter periplasmic adaptor subunit [Bernardetiaceae bacterium]|nr:efflux RND transporter periplasmic adaptor subunit [Bernardetiaceae bacterium]
MNNKKKSNKWIWILSIAVVLLIALGITAKKAGWVNNSTTTAVTFATVQRTEIIEKVGASGKIQPEVEIKIAPDVPGEIIELNIREGDSVLQGALLLRIRPDNYINVVERSKATLSSQRANLAQTKAQFEQSKAQYIRAKNDFARQEKLFKEDVISEQEFQTAQANFEVAQSELQAAEQRIEAARFTVKSSEASVNEAKQNLTLTSVFAPMSGIVSQLNVEQGERVVGTSQMAGTEMLRIAELNNMEVSVNVNENDIVRVSLKDSVEVEVDAYPDEKFKGIVTSIANSAKGQNLAATDAVTEFEVRIRILRSSYEHLVRENNPYPFRPGMTANVEIITKRKTDALAVPLAAVTTRDINKQQKDKNDDNDKDTRERNPGKENIKEVVFVLDENNKARMKVVKIGISDYENIEILEGLKENDKIISGPYQVISKTLRDGDLVEEKEERFNLK